MNLGLLLIPALGGYCKLRRRIQHSQSDHSSAGQHTPPAEDAEPTGPTSS